MNFSKKLTSALLVGFVFSVSQHLQAQTTVEKGYIYYRTLEDR